MGILRFLLAVCVVATHTGPLFGIKWMNGLNAVVVFFIISGFYMSLILNEKYTGNKRSYGLFIGNRLLRVMPLYWIVLLAHFILCCIGYFVIDDALTLQIYVDHHHQIPLNGWIIFIFCNLFIVGMDALYYVHLVPSQGLIWSLKDGMGSVWFMLMLQAWTLSIELLFYFIAPFIVRKKKRIISITLLLLSMLIFCRIQHFDPGNLTKSGFVLYLIYFLLGATAWLIYNKIKTKVNLNACKIIFGIYLICLILFPYFLPENELQIQVFYVITFLSIPFIFNLSKNWKWDSIIGEYSYPVYITHIMVNDLLKLLGLDKTRNAELNLFISLAISYLLIRLVANPIERLRQHRMRNKLERT